MEGCPNKVGRHLTAMIGKGPWTFEKPMMELPQQTKDKTPSKTQNFFSLSSLSSSVM